MLSSLVVRLSYLKKIICFFFALEQSSVKNNPWSNTIFNLIY